MGFQVLRTSAASDEENNSAFLFLLADDKLGRLFVREGPEYFREEEVKKYYDKNRSKALVTWIGSEGRLESVFERDSLLMDVTSALESILSKSNIDSIGLSHEIKTEIGRSYKITKGKVPKNKSMEWLAKEVAELVSSD